MVDLEELEMQGLINRKSYLLLGSGIIMISLYFYCMNTRFNINILFLSF